MALSDFTGPTGVDDWSADLDRRWPERGAAARAVVAQIAAWAVEQNVRPARALELGIGACHLSAAVLDVIDQCPVVGAGYTGLDIEPRLLDHGRSRLSHHDPARIDLHQVDLNDSNWSVGLPPVDVTFSLQSIHDLAGYQALQNIYQGLAELLRPGGLLINADFVEAFPQDDPQKPRRFPVSTHEALLTARGFSQFSHSRHGKLACMSAIRSARFPVAVRSCPL